MRQVPNVSRLRERLSCRLAHGGSLSRTTALSTRLALAAAFLIVSSAGASQAFVAMAQRGPQTKSQRAPVVDKECPSPEDEKLALAQASSLLEQAQNSEAAEKLQPLAALPCDARFNLLLAAAFDGMNDNARAAETLRQAQSFWPLDNSVAASLAREYMRRGEVDQAVQAVAHFHPDAATPVQEIDAAAVVLLAGHRLASAEAVARVAYQSHPSIHFLLLLANTLQVEGRYKDVITLLQAERATYAQSAPFLVTLAESEFDADMLDAARHDLEGGIKLDGTLYQAHYLLGNVWMKQGDADKASAEYRVAIDLAPDQPRTYYQLALALRAKQDETGEEQALLKALALNGNYAAAHSEMGRIRMNQNRIPEAVEQLELAIQQNPKLEQPYNLLARAYNRLGETDKADAAARRLAVIRAANHRSSDGLSKSELQGDQAKEPSSRF